MIRHGSTPAEAVSRAQVYLEYWVHLHAQVIGYRIALLFCAILAAIGLAIATFIDRRKEASVFDAEE
jgi:hypothetical protein